MHPLKLTTIITLLAGACGGPASTSTDTDATSTTHPHDSDHHEASETGTTAGTHATDDHGSHATDDHGSSTHATDDHGSSTHATDDHGSSTHATDDHGTTDGGTPAEQFCFCMLERCHDLYHATWGEDHEQSEAMCLAVAEAVPSVGMPATSGDSIECRLHFCEMGMDVAGACEAAMGADPCVD